MNNQNPSYFSILTADVRYDKGLTYFEKILFSEITSLSNKYGYCTATNNYFSNLYDIKSNSISRNIRHLKERGYLEVELIRNGKEIKTRKLIPNNNRVNTPNNPTVKGCTPYGYQGINPTVKGNNTSNNNTSNNNSSKSKVRTYESDDPNLKLANYLLSKIRERNSNVYPMDSKNQPDTQKWANDIRLMHERDARSYEDIKRIIEWCQQDSFWQDNILSASKLRKQFKQLVAKADASINKFNNNQSGRKPIYDLPY